MLSALLLGVGIGALAAANIGPIWLLCTRTAARFGWGPGASIGAGAAIIDVAYALVGALGAAALLEIHSLRTVLGLVGSAVIVYLGIRTLRSAWRIRQGWEITSEVIRPRSAFRTGIIATASNPVTIITWGAVFSSASVASATQEPVSIVAFVLGIGLGSGAVHCALAWGAARMGRVLSARAMLVVDTCAGAALIVVGCLLGARATAVPESSYAVAHALHPGT